MLKDLKGGQCPPEQRAEWREVKLAHWTWGWVGGCRPHRPSLVGHGAELQLLPESCGKTLQGSEQGRGNTLVFRDDPSGNNVEGLR